MTDRQTILHHLTIFRQRDKFSDAAWAERGLNPSNSVLCASLEKAFNKCTDQLITAVQAKSSPRVLRGILKKELRHLRRIDYDTEEAEFISDYFHLLARIVEVDFGNWLNGWHYGAGLS